jgi:hypothetical protein
MQAYSPAVLEKQDFKYAPTKNRAEKYAECQVCRCRIYFSANHDDGFPNSMSDGFDVFESQEPPVWSPTKFASSKRLPKVDVAQSLPAQLRRAAWAQAVLYVLRIPIEIAGNQCHSVAQP